MEKGGSVCQIIYFLRLTIIFGHEAPCTKFTRADGSPLRAFSCAAECDEFMIARHNEVVKPTDRVYFLGDLSMSDKHIAKVSRMTGRKVLIKGNHDTAELKKYLPFFDDIRGSHQFDGVLLTHIPVHPDSLARWGFNVHGHTHANRVLDQFGNIDSRYFCVSVEQINYTPISLEEIKKHKPKLELPKRI